MFSLSHLTLHSHRIAYFIQANVCLTNILILSAEPSSVALSSQDMELLRRWTVMQNPGQSEHVSQSPPHPEPAVSPPQATAIVAKSVSARSSVNSCSTQKPEVSLSSQQIASSAYFTTTSCKHRQILAKKTTGASTVTLSSSVSITPSRMTSGGTVLFPSTQLTLSQANFIPVIAIPSSVNPSQLEIKRIFQPTQIPVTSVPSSLQTSDSSHNFVHAGVLKQNPGSFHTDIHTVNTHSVAETDTAADVQTENVSPVLPAQVSFPHVNNIIGDKIGIQINVNHNQFSTSIVSAKGSLKSEAEAITKDDELSPRSQGNDLLEFLNHHLRDTSGEKHIQEAGNATMQTVYVNQNPVIHQQNGFMLDGTSPEANQQHNLTPPPPYNAYSQACNSQELARSSSTPSLLRQNSNSPNFQSKQHELQHRSSVPVITCGDQAFSSFPVHNNFTAGFQTSQDSQPESFPQTNTAASFESSFTSQNDYHKFPQAADVINFDSQIHHSGMLFQSASDFSLPMQHQQLCNQAFQSNSYNEFNSFSSCATSRLSSMQYHHSLSEYSKLQAQQPEFSSNQSFQTTSYVGAASSHIVTQQIPDASRPHASLHSQTSAANAGSFTSLLQQHGADILPGQPTQGEHTFQFLQKKMCCLGPELRSRGKNSLMLLSACD